MEQPADDEERDEREPGQQHVERRSPGAEPGHRNVTVEVADQEDALEEEEDRRPHGRRAAEDRQDEAPDQRFDAEQQERRQPDRQGERQRRAQQRTSEDEGAGGHRVSERFKATHGRGTSPAVN